MTRWSPPPTPTQATSRGPRRQAPITVDQIVEISFGIIASEGYEALTMRRVATVLQTGPASLYAHVTNKAALDDLLLGRLHAELDLPTPDASSWRDQLRSVCAQLRDQYLRYPGISRAAMAGVPTSLETLRLNEGMLAIALAGGLDAQKAAWTIDALVLYVAAYTLELSSDPHQNGWADERAEVLARFNTLPADEFPHIRQHAEALTSGTGHERFDFTISLLLGESQAPVQ